MGIKVADAESVPELVYENVHMENLTINQVPIHTNNEQAKYSIQLTYRMYAIHPETNKRFYKQKNHTILVEDFLTLAFQKAATGDTDLLYALGAIETAVATLLEDMKGVDATVV